MTREEVIRIAKEAGIITKGLPVGGIKTLEAFADLVATAEREACAEVAMQIGTDTNSEDFALDKCYEIANAIRARKP